MDTTTRMAEIQFGLLLMRRVTASQFWFLMARKRRRRDEVAAAAKGGRSEIEVLVSSWITWSESVLSYRGWLWVDYLLTLGAVLTSAVFVSAFGSLTGPAFWPAAGFVAWLAVELTLHTIANKYPRLALVILAFVGFSLMGVMIEMSTGPATVGFWQIAALVIGLVPWFIFATRIVNETSKGFFDNETAMLGGFWRKAGVGAETRRDMAREIEPLSDKLEPSEIEGLAVRWPQERTGRRAMVGRRAILQASGSGLVLVAVLLAIKAISEGSPTVVFDGVILRAAAMQAALLLALVGLPGLSSPSSSTVTLLSAAVLLAVSAFFLVSAEAILFGSWPLLATLGSGLLGSLLILSGVRTYSDG